MLPLHDVVVCKKRQQACLAPRWYAFSPTLSYNCSFIPRREAFQHLNRWQTLIEFLFLHTDSRLLPDWDRCPVFLIPFLFGLSRLDFCHRNQLEFRASDHHQISTGPTTFSGLHQGRLPPVRDRKCPANLTWIVNAHFAGLCSPMLNAHKSLTRVELAVAAGEGVDADTLGGVPVDVDRRRRRQPCAAYWDPQACLCRGRSYSPYRTSPLPARFPRS